MKGAGQLLAHRQQSKFLNGSAFQLLPKGAAVDVLQHQVRTTVVQGPGGVHVDDVGVARQPTQRLAFPVEPELDDLVLNGGVADLDRHLPIDIGLAGQPDVTKTATTDASNRLKAVEFE